MFIGHQTDKRIINHKMIKFCKSENHKIENKSIDGKLIIFKQTEKMTVFILIKLSYYVYMGFFIPDFTAYVKYQRTNGLYTLT